MAYDPQNIFARIIRGELPSNKVYEDDHVLAFHDIAPKAPVHIMIVPKGPYATIGDFTEQASDYEILHFNRAIAKCIAILDLEKTGYRLISNNGSFGHQEVPHFHMHIVGGKSLGAMLPDF
jgi:diadenosine tetraphosphate (Ap4A) HIT family hydrolase